MEIEGEDGSITLLKKGFKREIGRGLGFGSKDRTVSRRHISFQLQTHPNSKARVHFEVIGKNPIWVYNRGNGEITVFRRRDGGEMEADDMFCVSAEKPLWFTLKGFEFEGEEEREVRREIGSANDLAESLQSSSDPRSVEDLELDSVDVSNIDPVKEFGFLVMGHEFDHYPKQKTCHAKTWDWFLKTPKEKSEEDDVSDKKWKKSVRRKRENAEGNDDDEWKGESEDDKELNAKSRKVRRPKYSTRLKESTKPTKDTQISKHSVQKKTSGANQEEEEEEEDEDDDNTLRGFIVTDDDMEEEINNDDDEDEEEEDYDEDDEE